jgi:hypothetical protein
MTWVRFSRMCESMNRIIKAATNSPRTADDECEEQREGSDVLMTKQERDSVIDEVLELIGTEPSMLPHELVWH